MRTFREMTLSGFDELLSTYPFTRRVDAVHFHHTWRPNHSQYRGYDTIVSMWRYHTEVQGWSDIAQHLTIAPDGVLWTGRSWNQPPCSASGHNGNRLSGPFMIEVIGDFDIGHDRFEGDQRDAALHVVRALQTKFQLPLESLRFHNEMSPKTCPGSSLTRSTMMEDLRRLGAEPPTRKPAARKARPKGDRPFGDEALAVHDLIGTLNAASRETPDPLDAELVEGEEAFVLSAAPSGRVPAGVRGGGSSEDLTPEMLHQLRPHVVNLSQGRFSKEGLFQTDTGDVDAIFEQHLPRWVEGLPASDRPPKLLFYAHGGLTSESAGLWTAHQQVEWWMANQVYPIFFVWETGFLETIKQLLFRSREQIQRAVPRDIWDFTTDPLIEAFCHTAGGVQIWSGMKRSAEQASAELGGARYVAERLKGFLDTQPSPVELHAVGHSAGSIFHAHFVPTVLDVGAPGFASMHFLAPAIRTDAFLRQLSPLLGNGVNHLSLFTMNKDLERDDDCGKVYRKSLLYLICNALEAERRTPILGLEASLRGDPELKKLFGLDGNSSNVGEVVWSNTASDTGRSASRSTVHGGFDNDRATMNSVARRVLNLQDTDALKRDFPEEATRGLRDIWSQPMDWPEELRFLARQPMVSAGAQSSTGQGAAGSATGGSLPQRAAATVGQGRKRALCIGIDQYATAPLAGCVADARAWSQALTALGFDDQIMLLDQQATRAGILDALTQVVTSSRAGDVVVFQYAGHGTTLPDLDGDEAGEDTPDHDEALCPFDFAEGKFVIDDDVAEVFRQLPDEVNLTCFIDCCHSGTISRFAVGGPVPVDDGTKRARYMVATPGMEQAHREFRQRAGGHRALAPRGPETMQEVVFSACLSQEVAWETGGHGDFTVKATDALRAGIDGVTNEQFQDLVSRAFGAQARQHPLLDCAKAARGRGLLKPLVMTGSMQATEPPSNADGRVPAAVALHSANGNVPIDAAVLNQLLKALTRLLEVRGA